MGRRGEEAGLAGKHGGGKAETGNAEEVAAGDRAALQAHELVR